MAKNSRRKRLRKLERRRKRAKLGTGTRTRLLVKELRLEGAKTPNALAAWIGRKKYGKRKYQRLSRKGR